MQNEKDLLDIALILDGNNQGYENILNRHKVNVFNTVLRIIRNRESSEEVSQDVFVKAFQSLNKFEGKSKFSTWLYRIAYTSSISYLRSNKSRKENSSDIELSTLDELGLHSSDYPMDIEQLDNKKFINFALNKLSSEDASVISLYYLQEQPMKEIAKILYMKENAVKIKLHRARKKLHKELVHLLNLEVKELL